MSSVERKFTVAALALALAFAAFPALGQAPATAPTKGDLRDAALLKQYPPPGRMVDIGGGRRMHLQCLPANRGPTVVIETGAVAAGFYYRTAAAGIATVPGVGQVCLYDRAGLGWSDTGPYPRSFKDRIDDLHALLARGKVKGPYILVGHSMGGLLVRGYAKTYPKGVVGMVLVEASEPVFNGTPVNLARVKQAAALIGSAIPLAQQGVEIPQLKVPNGPPEQAIMQRASVIRADQDDMVAMSTLPDQLAGLGGLGSLGDLPLVVIQRGKRDPTMSPAENDAWLEAQKRNAALSTRSVLITADKSGHNVNFEQPELYATAVAKVLELGR